MTRLFTLCAGAALGLLIATAAYAAAFDPAAATQSYLATMADADKARSDAYFEGGYWLILWNFLWSLGVAWVLLHFRWSAAIRDWAERITGRTWLAVMLYAIPYIALSSLLTLPLTVYQNFLREHAYGLATQDFPAWLGEYLIALGVNLVLGTVALALLYVLIRRLQARWWAWGAGLAVLFLAFVLLISPVFIAPLFNSYTPMPESALKEEIISMARANGVPADDVFVVDASRQSTRISANVSGLWGTTRISLNDNLLKRGTAAEIKAVMGHELGHYVLGHIYEFLAYFGILLVVGFAFIDKGFAWAQARWGTRWGVRSIADPAGLPLFFALFSLYFFVLTPVVNSITRANEAEADIFGLNAARAPDGFATIALKLSDYRKIDPAPWEEALMYDHPSGRSRIFMAMRWKAENLSLDDAPREEGGSGAPRP